jgi:hypothetical protein
MQGSQAQEEAVATAATAAASLPPISPPGLPTQLTNKAGVARALLVSQRTVDRWVQQGRIPVFSRGPRCRRFHLPEVMAALAGNPGRAGGRK